MNIVQILDLSYLQVGEGARREEDEVQEELLAAGEDTEDPFWS